MKAIYAKYIGPSNVRGSRYKATDNDGNSITLGADHALGGEANKIRAILALVTKMGWNNVWVSNGDCAVAVAKSDTPEVISDWAAIDRYTPKAAF